MRFEDFSDIGGFLWWLLIKFCKTKLEEEQVKQKWSRNIIFLLFIFYLVSLIFIKLF
jgi:hypothetical protein